MTKVAISQRVDVAAKGAERRDCLDQRWSPIFASLGMVAIPIPNLAADAAGYLQAIGAVALVLSGGNDLAQAPGARSAAPERDAVERAAFEYCVARGLPVLGVCRGMQAINMFLGGGLEPTSGHAGTRHSIRTIGGNPFGWPEEFDVNSYHDYRIPAAMLAAALEPLALASDESVEAFRHRSARCVGIMWHPERESALERRDAELIGRLFRGR